MSLITSLACRAPGSPQRLSGRILAITKTSKGSCHRDRCRLLRRYRLYDSMPECLGCSTGHWNNSTEVEAIGQPEARHMSQVVRGRWILRFVLDAEMLRRLPQVLAAALRSPFQSHNSCSSFAHVEAQYSSKFIEPVARRPPALGACDMQAVDSEGRAPSPETGDGVVPVGVVN